jgi:hypothetical protein
LRRFRFTDGEAGSCDAGLASARTRLSRGPVGDFGSGGTPEWQTSVRISPCVESDRWPFFLPAALGLRSTIDAGLTRVFLLVDAASIVYGLPHRRIALSDPTSPRSVSRDRLVLTVYTAAIFVSALLL